MWSIIVGDNLVAAYSAPSLHALLEGLQVNQNDAGEVYAAIVAAGKATIEHSHVQKYAPAIAHGSEIHNAR